MTPGVESPAFKQIYLNFHTPSPTLPSLPKGVTFAYLRDQFGAPSSPVYAFGGHEVFPRGNLLKNS